MASKDLQNIFNTLNWSHSVETKLQGLLIAKVSCRKYFFHAFFFFEEQLVDMKVGKTKRSGILSENGHW